MSLHITAHSHPHITEKSTFHKLIYKPNARNIFPLSMGISTVLFPYVRFLFPPLAPNTSHTTTPPPHHLPFTTHADCYEHQLHRRAAVGALSWVRIESARAPAMAGDFDHQRTRTSHGSQLTASLLPPRRERLMMCEGVGGKARESLSRLGLQFTEHLSLDRISRYPLLHTPLGERGWGSPTTLLAPPPAGSGRIICARPYAAASPPSQCRQAPHQNEARLPKAKERAGATLPRLRTL